MRPSAPFHHSVARVLSQQTSVALPSTFCQTQDTRSTSQPSNQNLMCRAFHMQHQQHYIIVAIIVAIIVRCSLLERDQRKLALLIISCLVQPGNPSHPWPVVFCPPPSPKGRAVVVRRATDGNLPSAARSLMNRLLAGCLTSSGGSMTDSDFWQELTAATGDSVQISHPRRLSADLATSSPVNYQGGGCPDCSPRRIPSTSPLLVSLILKRKHYPRACPWLRCSSPPTTALAGNLGTQADQQADERRACRPCVPTYRARMHQQQRSTGKSRSRVRTGLTCSRRLSTETFFLFLVLLIRLSSLEKFSPHTRSRADGLNRSHGCSCS
ncbi:hypothetical protein IWX49DRAFT_168004 [Phyllosticta citricarpa]|uniref:Uncharacterized protein n=1 Tax=Phyllosticta paracitricarpa TaxID=2016321 RepID=A0ABR1N5C9_9PEZI